ncbi:MAG: alpha/beta fold hydrolase [Ruminococcus sp.]|nr:alpha/beta fold hydrolase [Ruminococcus sp.]
MTTHRSGLQWVIQMIDVMEKRFPSADGNHVLYGRIYAPETEARGLFHVVHGMVEHIGRYDGFMRKMAENGWICYGFDNLGHGKTAANGSELGYIGGYPYLLADVRRFTAAVKHAYGNHLPCVLMGHSMGSFIARCTFTDKLWNKLIIMGTGGPNPILPMGVFLLNRLIRVKGERYTSNTLEMMVFSSYNNHFDEVDAHAWLSSIPETRDLYHADRFCAFHFCVASMKDLLQMLRICNRSAWFGRKELNVPVLLISGDEDPVGNYGKGVKTVYNRLIKNGKNAQLKLYHNCRHEILNDVCREEVIRDILDFSGAGRSETSSRKHKSSPGKYGHRFPANEPALWADTRTGAETQRSTLRMHGRLGIHKVL